MYCQKWVLDRDSVFKCIKLTPGEVSEYGFNQRRVYRSREIIDSSKTKRVFLRLEVDGEMSLYSYSGHRKKRYYVELDSTGVVALPGRGSGGGPSHREILRRVASGCEFAQDASGRLGHSKSALSRFVKYYNRCEAKPFPSSSFGLHAGYESTSLFLLDENHHLLSGVVFPYQGGITAGVFADKSLGLTYFSLHSELRYSHYEFAFYSSQDHRDIDYFSRVHSIGIPLMMRYTVPVFKRVPYFNGGALYTYNLVNEGAIFKTRIMDGMVNTIKETNSGLVDDHNLGFVLGAGIKAKMDSGQSLIFEVRFSRSAGMSYFKEIGTNSFALLIGLEL